MGGQTTREIRTGKGGNWFCYPEYIDSEMAKLFTKLADEDHLRQISDPESFAAVPLTTSPKSMPYIRFARETVDAS